MRTIQLAGGGAADAFRGVFPAEEAGALIGALVERLLPPA
ncbi:hypothetical protein CU044_2893 [Streptomyces sp. L-9-10]|nr:hypothetical protein CU044_2893 [Streptomyces sp. L-9-10]